MKDIKKVELSTVQEQEHSTNSSVRLNNHDIPKFCPPDEVECYQVILEKKDLERIFILWELGFNELTNNNSFKVSDLIATKAQKLTRVKSFLDDRDFDLRLRPDRRIILFGTNLDTLSLTATDGNHRLIAHFIEHENIDEIPAFIYIHKNINNWQHIPPLAR